MRKLAVITVGTGLLWALGCAESDNTPADVPVELPEVLDVDGETVDVDAEGVTEDGDVEVQPEEGTTCTPTGLELCDGRDNDCDTTTDEDYNLQTDPTNCGECGTVCDTAPHAWPACSEGECGIACDAGWTDANVSPVDGCEYACTVSGAETGAACEDALDNDCDTRIDNTDTDCSDCVPEFCNLADDDCDGLTDEDIDIDFDPANCGRCGTVCPTRDHAIPACTLGDCDITCEAGWSNTNGDLLDGCEATCVADPAPDETICNGVDNDCDGRTDEDYAPYQCGTGLCTRDSVCSHGMPVCEPRHPPATTDATCDNTDDDCDGETDEDGDCRCTTPADCDDGNPCTTDVCGTDLRCVSSPAADDSACPSGICCSGRCVDALSDSTHCGTCAGVCGLGSTCSSGSCACSPGLLNCDSNWGNGCEVSGATDPLNCGACGTSCGLHGSCTTSACSCVAPYLNCNAGWTDGCEVEPATDPANCGSCGNSCGVNASCSAGSCGCATPYLNCDGVWATGCEVNPSTDAGNCGRCGNSCGSNSSCSSGSCACSSPWLNCNSSWSDGCEVNPTSDGSNCGSCGNRCGSNAYCASSSCNCNTGWGNCSGGWVDGCETSLTSLTNCGSCGRSCDLAHTSESCSTGTCTIGTCDGGWGDCSGGSADGCESALTTLANCGRCGSACNPANASGATCSTGTCNYVSCNTNWGDCNGTRPDGCETSLTSLSNCGGCGTSCSRDHASESCSTGTCTLGTCDSGWGNCDGSSTNGCETSLTTSTSCGTSCSSVTNCTTLPNVSGGSCSSGTCSIPDCVSGYAECDNVVSNGCERDIDDNVGTCSGAVSMGSVSGDTGSGTLTLTRTLWGEMWYRFSLTEDDSSIFSYPYISATITLDVPSDVDYDMYVYCTGSGCSGDYIYAGEGIGVTESVGIRWNDTPASSDTRTVYVEIRFWSGGTLGCGEWTLTVRGDTPVSDVTC